jgi:hypothetical protein
MKSIEKVLINHLYEFGIVKKNAEKKKIDSLLDTLIGSFIRYGITLNELENFIDDIKNDLVFNKEFFNKGGNVMDYINPKWCDICKTLWRQRSVGLGTPNAASGEGELMFLFISKHITKPKKGDLKIGDEIIELKGEGVRVNSNISGKDFLSKSLDVLKKYNLQPNKSFKNNFDSFEIEKEIHQKYWDNEMTKLSLYERKNLIKDYLGIINNKDNNVDDLFTPDFDFVLFKKVIVKILYSVMVDNNNFNKFVLLGDGTNVKIFSRDVDVFNSNVDNGNIKILNDYFRINQNMAIGWYIE